MYIALFTRGEVWVTGRLVGLGLDWADGGLAEPQRLIV